MSDPVFHWFLPTSGDGHGVGDGARTGVVSRRHRPASLDYLTQIAQAAEHLGFEGVLTPTGTWCEEAWLTSCALSQRTRLPFAASLSTAQAAAARVPPIQVDLTAPGSRYTTASGRFQQGASTERS